MLALYHCPQCGSSTFSEDGSRYVVDGQDVCGFTCWMIRVGGTKAILTAELMRRAHEMPRLSYGGNA